MPRKRYPGFWRPAKGDDFPSSALCVDCDSEMYDISNSPRVQGERLIRWCAYLWRASNGVTSRTREAVGQTASEFWYRMDQLLGDKTTVWLFCTPASRVLALLGFWEQLEAREIVPASGNDRDSGDDDGGRGKGDFGSIILEDPPTVAIVKRANRPGKIKLCDLRNYGPEASSWGEGAAARCRAGGEWVQAACRILRDGGLGSWKCTAGSQAVYSYRRSLMDQAPYVHTFRSMLALERDAYFGGRCEAYYIGDIRRPIYHLDVRSMYPHCGLTGKVPLVPGESYPNGCTQAEWDDALSMLCIADVTIETDQPDYPVLCTLTDGEQPTVVPYWQMPFVGKPRGQVIYPVGRYRTALCGPELNDALLHCRVKEIHRVSTYHGSKALAPFMSSWYGLLKRARMDGDQPTQSWIKRVMVSLIGRFGETGKRWVDSPTDTEHDPYHTWPQVDKEGVVTRYRNIARYTQREDIYGESENSCPAISAWITSLARTRLLHLMRAAGRPHVLYCDTDALLLDTAGYQILAILGEIRPDDIGYLRVLGQHTTGRIYGVKHYELDGVVKCAGLPRGTVDGTADAGHAWWRQGLGDAVVSGRRPDSRRVLLSYARSRGYRHGVVARDGKVTPWELGG